MQFHWTSIVAGAAALCAMQQQAHAEARKIDCATVPYKVKPSSNYRPFPKCTVEEVSDATKTYAVYRDVTLDTPTFARIIVVYKASKGGFGIKFGLDNDAAITREKSAVLGTDGMAWAFDGLLVRRPKAAEVVYRAGSPATFEAHVKALGGKLADCYPTSKYSDRGSASADTMYAVGLACIAKGSSDAGDELSVVSTLWGVEWEGAP